MCGDPVERWSVAHADVLHGAPQAQQLPRFLVIFFIKQLVDAVNEHQLPVWVRVALVTGNELLLVGTVLCHEMGPKHSEVENDSDRLRQLGHGTMARRCGGTIAEVLLWPFGGICFTTRPSGRNGREKLVDDLWIVAAGPATHFPMSGAWVALLAAYAAACSHVVTPSAWKYLVPFSSVGGACMDPAWPGCFHSYFGWLMYSFLCHAVQLNAGNSVAALSWSMSGATWSYWLTVAEVRRL
eukprot:Skav228362  [mRNA]  locus=scaffold1981:122928:138890:+ [translate_table: standard]